MDNPLQFLILTPFGVGEWKTTPVYDSTAEFPLVFPTGPVGGASVNLGFKLVSQASQNAAKMCCTNSTWDLDGFWHPTEEEGRNFWALWWKSKALRNISSTLDPFALSSQRSPKAQAFGGERTVDVETPGFFWGESDVGPDVPTPPAPPLISVLTPTPDPAYDIQVFWQPFDNDAWEASVKLRVGDDMPEFNLGEGGKFHSMAVFTQKGFEKVKALNAPSRFNEGMAPPFSLGSEVTTSLVQAWRNPPTPPKPVLTWEDGRETLRTLVVSSYRVLTETQQVQIAQLLEDFKHFSAVRERYPNLAYFMGINTMQRALDAVLGLD